MVETVTHATTLYLIGFEYVGYIGDDVCDGGQYNTPECNWDSGDCFCMNEATNGEFDRSSSKMLVECEAACKISPLLVSRMEILIFVSSFNSFIIIFLT
jgi:hypothetical protein